MRTVPNLTGTFAVLLEVKTTAGEYYRTASEPVTVGTSPNEVEFPTDNPIISISPIEVSDLKEASFDIVLSTPSVGWPVDGTWAGYSFKVWYYWADGTQFLVAAGKIVAINILYKTDVLGERLVKLTGGSPTYAISATAPWRISKDADPVSFDRMHDDFSKIRFRWGTL